MEILLTEDGYVKVSFEDIESILFDQIAKMNANPYILPSLRERYERNSVLYYIGEFIPMSEYFKKQSLSFETLKQIVLKCVEGYISIKENGFIPANVLCELEYIYINPKTLEIKLLYCPVCERINAKSCQEFLRNVCEQVETKNATLLLGTLLEQANQKDFSLEKLQDTVEKVTETVSGKPQIVEVEKIIEKPVEVERIVEKPVEVEKIVEKVVEKKIPVEKIVEKVVEKPVDSGKIVTSGIITALVTGVLTVGVPFIATGDFFVKPATGNLVMYVAAVFFMIIVPMVFMKSGNETKDAMPQRSYNQPVQPVQTPRTAAQPVQPQRSQMQQAQAQAASKKPEERMSDAGMKQDSKVRSHVNEQTGQVMSRRALLESDGEDDGSTSVLSGNNSMLTAYLHEEGKTSLMDRIFVDCEQFIVGRDNSADFRIDEGFISKKHAQITYKNNSYFIKDLGSSNFTYLNGEKLSPQTEFELKDNSQVSFGKKKFIFKRG